MNDNQKQTIKTAIEVIARAVHTSVSWNDVNRVIVELSQIVKDEQKEKSVAIQTQKTKTNKTGQ